MSKERDFKAMIAILIVGAVACFVLFFLANQRLSEFDSQKASNEDTIRELNQQIYAVSNESTETVENIQVRLVSASKAGTKVSDLQNQYRTIDISTKQGEDELHAIVQEMEPYLDDSSKVVPWYAYQIDDVSYQWKFESTYSFDATEIPVVWTCKTDDGVLLAYATAVYNAESSKFQELEYHMTSTGASYIPAS